MHMIGHELTALHGLDHAQSLAVVLPAMWKVRRTQKAEKLIQYAERVLGITDGSDDEKIDKAIEMTEAFFNELGTKTRLSDYGIKETDIPKIIANLEKHGMTKLSEKGGDVTPDVSELVLRTAL